MAMKINNEFLKQIYPIGSIYMSMNGANPKDLFGGVWEQIIDYFLWATKNTPGKSGGEKEHSLVVEELPKHEHYEYFVTNDGNRNPAVIGTDGSVSGTYAKLEDQYFQSKNPLVTGLAGGDKPHNNMPPYLEVYMWKRIG